MKTRNAFVITCACIGSVAAIASAGQINVSDIGGGIILNSGPLSLTTFGNGPSSWTSASLAAVHTSLNAGGVSTNGKITFLAVDSDNGLSLLALVDQQLVGGLSTLGHVRMDSVANGTSLAFVNDAAGGVTVTPSGLGSRTASGEFVWNSNGSGVGFAWAGLNAGNTITFRFNRSSGSTLGLDDPSTFQFINWTGSAWAPVSVSANLLSFTDTNDFGFAASVVVPGPSAAAIALGALLPIVSRRRAR